MALGLVVGEFDEQVDEIAGGGHVQLPATHCHHHRQLTTGRFVEDKFYLVEDEGDLCGLINDLILVPYCCEKLSHIASLLGERSRCGD